MGTAGTAGGGGGAHPGFYPTGGKVKHPPAGPCPKQRESGADQPLSSPSTCPHAAAKAVPAGGPCRSAVPADTLAQKTWLSVRDERATREPFREGCARRPAWRLGEVGGGELERLSWRQVQRVPAAPWRGSFLPPSLPPLFLPSLFSSFPSSRLPFSLIPAQSPSCHPDSSPSPPPTVTCKPKDKTRPPSLPAGPQSGPKVRLGHGRSPGAHSAASCLIPAHLSGPGGSCSFYGARRQKHCQGVPSPLAWAAAASMPAIHTQGPLLGPGGVVASRPPPSTGPGWR